MFSSNNTATYQWGPHYNVGLKQAWDRVRGTAYVGVVDRGLYGQLDTRQWGYDVLHPDHRANFRSNFSRNLDGPADLSTRRLDISNPAGHGNLVTGVLAATVNNSAGIAGVCWNCSVMFGKAEGEAAKVPALFELIRTGAQVINMSWGGLNGGPDHPNEICPVIGEICDAIAQARIQGIALVAASGNYLGGVPWPANLPGVIAAGGINDQGAFWENGLNNVDSSGNVIAHCEKTEGKFRGTTDFGEKGSNCGAEQTVVAPARNILTTFLITDPSQPRNTVNPNIYCIDTYSGGIPAGAGYFPTGYGTCTGTSFASPFVAGIAGLMKTANPMLSGDDVKEIIKRRAGNNNGVRMDDNWGHGLVHAERSVIGALSGANQTNTEVFDPQVINRLTPLLGFFSNKANNHFYTTVPQMATAAANGTLRPLPRNKVVRTDGQEPTWSATCVFDSCSYEGLNLAIPSTAAAMVKYLDDSQAIPSQGILFDWSFSLPPVQVQPPTFQKTGSDARFTGTVHLSASNSIQYGTVATVRARVEDSDFPVAYSPIGIDVSSFVALPGCVTPCQAPRALASVFTTHVNPYSPIDAATGLPGAPFLAALYRLSWRCGDSPLEICDNPNPNPGAPPYNPYHVSHFYTTNPAEVAAYTGRDLNGNVVPGGTTKGYQLDGIEGYVFPVSQWQLGSQPLGHKLLCRKYDPTREDFILFLASYLGDCMAGTTDGYGTGGNYNSWEPVSQSYYIGYVKDVVAAQAVFATPPGSIQVVSGDNQPAAALSTSFQFPLRVQVKDTAQAPMAGITVIFQAPTQTGQPSATLSSPTTITDQAGYAQVTATANCTTGGPYIVTARITGVAGTVQFHLTNTLGPPYSLSVANGTSPQSAVIQTSFVPLAARLTDCGSNPLAGQTVTFSANAAASGATATLGTPSLTNAQGIATITATANTKAGSYAAFANKAGLISAAFALTNLPGAANKLVGPNPNPALSAQIGNLFPTLGVWVRDQFDNAVPGIAVTYVAPSSGPSAAFAPSAVVATDADGLAAVAATANSIMSATGTSYTVAASATVPNGSPFNFSLSNTAPPPPPVLLNNGFEAPVIAGASNTTNAPITNWTCAGVCGLQHDTWQTSPEGTQTAFVRGFADSSGFFPAGSIYQAVTFSGVGTYKLRFKAARRPGEASAQPIRVKIDGVPVGALVAPIDEVFGQYESAAFTIAAGTHQVALEATDTATGGGLTSLIDVTTIALTAAPRNLAVYAGNNQTTPGNAAFGSPLQVRVTDAGSNPVAGATVTFNVPGIAAYPAYPPAFANLSASTVLTDASGIASVSATANNMAGTYSVNASIDEASAPVGFTLTNSKLALAFVNASFEYPPTPGGSMVRPAGSGWTFNGVAVGIVDTLHNTYPTSAGRQAAFLTHYIYDPDGVAAAISQTINFTVGGTYTLAFKTALWNGWTGGQGVRALLDNGYLSLTCSPGMAWMTCTMPPFTLAAGTHTIQLETSRNTRFDPAPILIDLVTIQ